MTRFLIWLILASRAKTSLSVVCFILVPTEILILLMMSFSLLPKCYCGDSSFLHGDYASVKFEILLLVFNFFNGDLCFVGGSF